jgi:soluble lytic murein transglycosylase-like protein
LHRKTLIIATALAAFAAAVPAVRAAELVTLTNGFVEHCNHHAQVDGRVRLYQGAGEDNYIELAPDQIVGFQTAPDPPPAAVREAAQPTAAPQRTPNGQVSVRRVANTPNTKLSATDLNEMLARAGQAHNVDADLLASVVKAESNGNTRAVSRVGAQGLMQLMPATAARLGVADSFEPGQNVLGGSAYLDALLTRYHNNLALALAAYNAGPQAVDKYHGIPPYRETRAYVARVIHEFNRRVLAREAAARSEASNASAPQAAGN